MGYCAAIRWVMARLLTALVVMAPGTASAQSAQLELDVEWATSPCDLPATFSVTLRNIGETTFWVPKDNLLGFARSLNVYAKQGDEFSTTRSYFTPPRPQGFWARAENFAELEVGDTFATEIGFDGTFTPHGYQVEPPEMFEGELRVAYTQPSPYDTDQLGEFGPVLIMDPDDVVWSEILQCPQ